MRLTLPESLSLFAIAVLFCASTQASGQAGQLDTTFANNGIFATTTSKSSAAAVAIQSDGKIVMAGTGLANNAFADTLIRLNTDGSLDSTFGSGGVANVTAAFGFFALAIQSDGKIVAAGATEGSAGVIVQVMRVETNGALDTSFGSGGITTTTAISFGPSGSLALQPNGAILVAAGNPSVLARFTSSGQLDTSFGGSGIVNLVNPGPTQIAVQANGKILVASGEPARLVFQAQPLVQAGTISRYSSNGALDKTFGASGTAACVASASALLLQSDGKIVVAGALSSNLATPPKANDVGFGVVRYSANGMIDKSFGTGGVATADFGTSAPFSGAFAVAIQSNGDVVAAGAAAATASGESSTSSFGLARFTSTGKLDTTFGSGGIVTTTTGTAEYSWLTGLAIQSDGKIVAVGTAQFNFVNDNAYVARYLAQ